MTKTILIGLGVLAAIVVVFCAVAALQPSELHVERSTIISAPPAVVFAQVNDLHKWQEFSPWAKRDLAAKNTFEGPSAGTGAVFAWAGNSEVGEGRMTIVESWPNELVRFRLDFVKPFEGTNDVAFAFTPQGDQTRGVWTMDRRERFLRQGDRPGDEHGRDDRRRFRAGSRRPEDVVRGRGRALALDHRSLVIDDFPGASVPAPDRRAPRDSLALRERVGEQIVLGRDLQTVEVARLPRRL